MFKRYLVGIGVALMSSYAAQAATFQVAADGSAEFDTIGSAVEAALANDEADDIEIAPGTYRNVDSNDEVFAIVGEDDLTIRGTDFENPPVILIEPNLNEEFLPINAIDGLIIQMAGSIRFENLIFLPSENFTLEPGVFNLISVVDHGTADNPSTLDVRFEDVLITHGTEENEPVTLTGWEDPREGVNSTRADAINIFAREPEDTKADAGMLQDTINLTLRDTTIAAFGSEVGHSIDFGVPNGTLTLLEGTRLTFPQNITVQNRDYANTIIQGREENPVIFYFVTGSRAINAWKGNNEWEHLWVIGTLPDDPNVRFQGSRGAVRMETQAESFTARHCLFANFWMSAIWGIYEFNSVGELEDPSGFTDSTYTFEDCTFFNTPVAHLIGSDAPFEQPVASNIIYRDCLFDWNGLPASGLLPIPQASLLPDQTALIDHGGALVEQNLNTTFSAENIAHISDVLFTDRSPESDVQSSGNIISNGDFGFVETVWNPETMQDYLVPTNASLLSGQASGGAALDGARTADFATPVSEWNLY